MVYLNNIFSLCLIAAISCSVSNNRGELEILDRLMLEGLKIVSMDSEQKYLLLKENLADEFRLYTYNLISERITLIDQSRTSQLSLTWHPDGLHVYFQAIDSSTNTFILYKINIQTKQRKKLMLPPSLTAIPPLRFSENGEKMAYIGTSTEASNLYVYEVDLEYVVARFDSVSSTSDFVWKNDSVLFLSSGNRSSTVLECNVNENSIDTVRSENFDIERMMVWGANLVFLAQDSSLEYRALFEYDPGKEVFKQITSGSENVVDFGIMHDSSLHYTIMKGMDFSFNSSYNRLNNLLEIEYPGFVEVLNHGNNKLYLLWRRLDWPAEVIVYDTDKDSIIDNIYFHKLRTTDFCPTPKEIQLKNDFTMLGATTYYWISDTDVERRRILIYIHGGPHIYESFLWSSRNDVFLKSGIDVAVLNYHGSESFTRHFRNITDARIQAGDIHNIREYLIRELRYNPQDIYFLSSSYGATPLLFSMRENNLVTNTLFMISPVFREIDCGLLIGIPKYIFFGSRDPTAFFANKLVSDECEEVSKYYQYIVYSNEGHMFHSNGNLANMYSLIVELINN